MSWSVYRPGEGRLARFCALLIVLAFGAGFVVRGWRLESTPIARPSPPSTFPLNEHYVANFARATQAFPESPAFSRSLLMLARK